MIKITLDEFKKVYREIMSTKWDEKSWQKEFLNMKSHSLSDAKLLVRGVKQLKDLWRLEF